MLALKITDVKAFTNKLFIGEDFDRFWLTTASIITCNDFTIDGKLREDYFDSDELEILKQNHRTYALWKEIKPYCHSIIRGRHTPLHFKIVLQLSHNQIGPVLSKIQTEVQPDMVQGLYMNIQYKEQILRCTTGISLKTFLPEKHLNEYWDNMVREFFRKIQVPFEEL